MTRLTRRQFGAAAAGGIAIAFSLRGRTSAQPRARLPGSLARHRMLDAWLRINADGTATIFTGKVELGQGILTALAQIAAEELNMQPARIVMISGDTARTPDEGFTSGSRSIEESGAAIRAACAEARDILIKLAAERLDWSFDQLGVQDGVVYAPGMRTISYAALAGSVDLHRPATGKVSAGAGRRPPHRRQACCAPRYPGQGHWRGSLCAGPAAARHAARARGTAAALSRHSREGRHRRRQAPARRAGRGARRLVPRRDRRARRTGGAGARASGAQRRVDRRRRPARSPQAL